MDGREQRGLEIATTKTLRQKGELWLVPSQGGSGTYVVDPTERRGTTCTCPDFEERAKPCKHVFAVEYTVRRQTTAPDGSTVTEQLRLTYRQEWSAYNAAQVNEKERVAAMLRDLCCAIDNPIYKRGRPRIPLADAVFCAVMKVYGGTSGRRAMCDLRGYADKGYIDRAPHYNSIFNALENPDLTPILTALIEQSAVPLAALETDFAIDSSGFTTSDYHRWFSAKYGREMSKAKWLKAHVVIGTKTNAVTAVKITENYGPDSADTLHLPALLDTTVRRGFGVEMLSADKAYMSKRNLAAIDDARAFPLIPFKSNVVPPNSKGDGSLWQRMYFCYMYRREEFLAHYHKRSNVETTFSMIKAKFGTRIRSKSPAAQVNELLAKILCHNLCCLVQSFYELGVEAEFWKAS
ncbi:MAG: Transposase, Is5 family group [Candidatus Eremiobacteraeota bacterium]|nr:Transposase, Is5 family group [Candidatus Eremiobacteraeota bacterium]